MLSRSAGESLTSRPPRISSRRRSGALDEGYTTYTNPAGMPALREAIAAKFEGLRSELRSGARNNRHHRGTAGHRGHDADDAGPGR